MIKEITDICQLEAGKYYAIYWSNCFDEADILKCKRYSGSFVFTLRGAHEQAYQIMDEASIYGPIDTSLSSLTGVEK